MANTLKELGEALAPYEPQFFAQSPQELPYWAGTAMHVPQEGMPMPLRPQPLPEAPAPNAFPTVGGGFKLPIGAAELALRGDYQRSPFNLPADYSLGGTLGIPLKDLGGRLQLRGGVERYGQQPGFNVGIGFTRPF